MNKLVNFRGFECEIEIGQYVNGRPAIQLYDAEDGMPVATATVNLVDVSDEQIRELAQKAGADPRRVTFVKNWSENEGMCAALAVAGVVRRLAWDDPTITALPVEILVCAEPGGPELDLTAALPPVIRWSTDDRID